MTRTHFFKSDAGRVAVLAAYEDILGRWPVPMERCRVSTRFGDTHVVIWGDDAAPPLVLCHGSVANASSWMGNAVAYGKPFRCYAIDMIGEPGFSAQVREPLDSESHALWLDDVLAELGVQSAHFTGISLGGWLALDYANRRPQKVVALAGVAPAGIGKQGNLLAKAWPLLFMGKKGSRKLREMVMGPGILSAATDDPMLSAFLAMQNLVMDNFRGRIVKIPQLTDPELKALDMPVLVIAGGKDVLVNSDDTKLRIETVATQITLDYRPDAYHFIQDTVGEVLDFFQDHADIV